MSTPTRPPAASAATAVPVPDPSGAGAPPAASPPPAAPAPSRAAALGGLFSRSVVVGAYVVMVLIFAIGASDTFLTSGTLKDILDQAAVPVILVCGLTLVLAVGEFDLSFTATVGLTAGIAIVLMSKHDVPVVLACGIALLAAVAVGLVVGFLVTLGQASSFIVTLAIGSAVTGLELALTGNETIYQGIPTSFTDLASHQILGLKWPVWLAAIVLAAAAVLLHRTRFGRHVRATGGNATAAYLAGVKTRRVRIAAFVITALLAGICALVLTSRASSYYPDSSSGFLLNTYAAVFLGAAIGRWRGFTVAGAAFGVLWIVTLQTGLTQLSAPAWTANFVQGLVLAAAVLIASRGRKGLS